MRTLIGVAAVLVIPVAATAADIEAGKAKVQTVCAACHGGNGVSVSDSIPNLAAQKAAYIESQLKALKEGSRKNQIMSAIAAQLSSDDIANVAAYLASQPGAATRRKIGLPAESGKDRSYVPGELQDDLHEVPHDQFSGDEAGALLLCERRRAPSRQGRQEPAGRLGASRGGLFREAGCREKTDLGRRWFLRA